MGADDAQQLHLARHPGLAAGLGRAGHRDSAQTAEDLEVRDHPGPWIASCTEVNFAGSGLQDGTLSVRASSYRQLSLLMTDGCRDTDVKQFKQSVLVSCRKLVEKADFHSLWELLQWYPRDYFDYRPAHEPWEEGGAIKGVARVLYRGLRGPAAIVDMAVDASPPGEQDDGGYFSEPGDEDLSQGVQSSSRSAARRTQGCALCMFAPSFANRSSRTKADMIACACTTCCCLKGRIHPCFSGHSKPNADELVARAGDAEPLGSATQNERDIRNLQFFKYTASSWVSRQAIAGINAGMDVAFRGKLRYGRGALPGNVLSPSHEYGCTICLQCGADAKVGCQRRREVDARRQ